MAFWGPGDAGTVALILNCHIQFYAYTIIAKVLYFSNKKCGFDENLQDFQGDGVSPFKKGFF